MPDVSRHVRRFIVVSLPLCAFLLGGCDETERRLARDEYRTNPTEEASWQSGAREAIGSDPESIDVLSLVAGDASDALHRRFGYRVSDIVECTRTRGQESPDAQQPYAEVENEHALETWLALHTEIHRRQLNPIWSRRGGALESDATPASATRLSPTIAFARFRHLDPGFFDTLANESCDVRRARSSEFMRNSQVSLGLFDPVRPPEWVFDLLLAQPAIERWCDGDESVRREAEEAYRGFLSALFADHPPDHERLYFVDGSVTVSDYDAENGTLTFTIPTTGRGDSPSWQATRIPVGGEGVPTALSVKPDRARATTPVREFEGVRTYVDRLAVPVAEIYAGDFGGTLLALSPDGSDPLGIPEGRLAFRTDYPEDEARALIEIADASGSPTRSLPARLYFHILDDGLERISYSPVVLVREVHVMRPRGTEPLVVLAAPGW